MLMLLLPAAIAAGQEHKIPVQNTRDGKLELKNFPGDLPIEGYSGNEIIITSSGGDFAPPERAKGLKPIYPGGNDNSGIGLDVEKNGNTVSVTCVLPITRSADYKIKVPDNLSLEVQSGCEKSSNISVSDMKNEIDIQNCHGINLKNVTGPLVLSTISGDINIAYGNNVPDKPVSINAISSEIDITLPARTAANLELKTVAGAFFSDFDFTQTKDNLKRIGGNDLAYALNGGGPKISITTVSGNVYIRKGS
ncbi:MAG: DUF4097 family beta strand repeat-containing protein [Bacteroidota bacterium]|nr:DUF4097 family beta strand repeat-containing protein [Bacteroidota bacterium]